MIKFLKTEPTVYVLQYRNGRLVREGAGLSLLYFAPTATIVAVPLHTTDLPFAFQESTVDFQTLTLQGQLSYRVVEPKRLAALLNYAVDQAGRHVSDDPLKLQERLMIAAQSVMRGLVQGLPLRAALTGTEALAARGLELLRALPLAAAHGVEILAFSLVSVRPTPETAKALEAAAREALLREADQAIYARRTAAVEQERKVKETEMGTEIAVETQRARLIDQRVENARKDTDSRAYAIERTLAPYKDADWRLLVALGGGDGKLLLAQALEKLADNAGKIGQLSITPDLLTALMPPSAARK